MNLPVTCVYCSPLPERELFRTCFHPELAALFTSAAILASSTAVNSFSAKEVGHVQGVLGEIKIAKQNDSSFTQKCQTDERLLLCP